jgi:hypothetical protein
MKGMVGAGVFIVHRRRQRSGGFGNLLMALVWIDFL